MKLYKYPISKYFDLHFNAKQFEISVDNREIIPTLQIEKYLQTCPIEFEILCDLLEYLNVEIPLDDVVTNFTCTMQYFENINKQVEFNKVIKWLDEFNIRGDSDFINVIGLLVFDYMDNTINSDEIM